MNNVVFHIDKENKVVVAVLKSDPNELFEMTSNMIDKFNKTHKKCGIDCDMSWNFPDLNCEYVGIARCSENDEFNEEFGKKLALARAKIKKAYAIQKNFFEITNWLDDFYIYMSSRDEKLYRNWIELLIEKDALLNSVNVEGESI